MNLGIHPMTIVDGMTDREKKRERGEVQTWILTTWSRIYFGCQQSNGNADVTRSTPCRSTKPSSRS